MPVLPSEEEAPSGIYDQVAKNPSSNTESTASEHKLHQTEENQASAKDFISKGPVIPANSDGKSFNCYLDDSTEAKLDLPPKASKEELKARSEELNK